MMEFTIGQERVFEIFDEIIDRDDEDIFKAISADSTLRTRIGRNFESIEGLTKIKSALHLYGMQGFLIGNSTISNSDLENCFKIDEDYKVTFDVEFAIHLADIYDKSFEEVRRIAFGDIKDTLELEALDKFVREHDDDVLFYEDLRKRGHIIHYIQKNFDTVEDFRKAFNIDRRLFPAHSRSDIGFYTSMGHAFERLVERAFNEVNAQVDCFHKFEGCWPDFVMDDVWLDAKLSKSTAFNGSETIEKYTKHTDYLTLIYAIEDMPDDDLPELVEGVELVHVFDYFPMLSDGLKNEFTTLIDEVTRRKRGERT